MQVSISTDPYAVFQDAEWALMIGAKPRGPGQERADLLDQNGRIFVEQVRLTCTNSLWVYWCRYRGLICIGRQKCVWCGFRRRSERVSKVPHQLARGP